MIDYLIKDAMQILKQGKLFSSTEWCGELPIDIWDENTLGRKEAKSHFCRVTYLKDRVTYLKSMKISFQYSTAVGWTTSHTLVYRNKRPLGLTAPLSNNTSSMIHSPMNTKWPWFDLSMPPKVKCHEVNWKTIYMIYYVYEKLYMMLHLGDTTL